MSTSGNRSNRSSTTGKPSCTLESARKEHYGIGTKASVDVDLEKYGRGKRKRSRDIDYLRLNDGKESLDSTPTSPKKSKSQHVPIRSGPSQHRQIAQKQVTVNPSVTTLSTVRSKKDGSESEFAEKDQHSNAETTLLGVQGESANVTSPVPPSTSTASSIGVRDAFLGVPEVDDLLLPDLGQNIEPTQEDILNQTRGATSEMAQEPVSTEDEQEAVDALLSLSNVRNNLMENVDLDLDDNSLLVPIGGQPFCEDIAPTTSQLGQLEVDSEIARMIAVEEHTKLKLSEKEVRPSTLIGVQDDNTVKPPETELEVEEPTPAKAIETTQNDDTRDTAMHRRYLAYPLMYIKVQDQRLALIRHPQEKML